MLVEAEAKLTLAGFHNRVIYNHRKKRFCPFLSNISAAAQLKVSGFASCGTWSFRFRLRNNWKTESYLDRPQGPRRTKQTPLTCLCKCNEVLNAEGLEPVHFPYVLRLFSAQGLNHRSLNCADFVPAKTLFFSAVFYPELWQRPLCGYTGKLVLALSACGVIKTDNLIG